MLLFILLDFKKVVMTLKACDEIGMRPNGVGVSRVEVHAVESDITTNSSRTKTKTYSNFSVGLRAE